MEYQFYLSVMVLFAAVININSLHPESCFGRTPPPNSIVADCDESKTPPAYTCTLPEQLSDNSRVCYFCLELDERQSFTRYFADEKNLALRAPRGRVWVFNESDGELVEYPQKQLLLDEPLIKSCKNNECTKALTLDGYTFKSVITINGYSPGPTLIIPVDSIVVVDVYNRLSESTSIHWHGMYQRNTPWMDGVEAITQCPIGEDRAFRYIFKASPSGTHWYHSHSGDQRVNGLFGGLIVRETPSVLDTVMEEYGSFVDNPGEFTFLVSDLLEDGSFTQALSGTRFFNRETPPFLNESDPRASATCTSNGVEVDRHAIRSVLINGRGKHPSVPYTKTELSVFSVQQNAKYRFRLIGNHQGSNYLFSINNHKLNVIATDGHFVHNRTVDYINIQAGERYDFILETNQEPDYYTMNVQVTEIPNSNPASCKNQSYLMENRANTKTTTVAIAILHYDVPGKPFPKNTMYGNVTNKSAALSNSCGTSDSCLEMNCPAETSEQENTDCIHVKDLQLFFTVDEATRPVYTTSTEQTLFFNFASDGPNGMSINARNFEPPDVPIIFAESGEIDECNIGINGNTGCAQTNANTTLCICTHVRTINENQSYRFVFSAVGSSAHPVHLHGHSFHVTRTVFSDSDIVCNNINSADTCTNPGFKDGQDPDEGLSGPINAGAPLKDTIIVPPGGYVVAYIKSDNPGYWFLHCHIEPHQVAGMAVVIREAKSSIRDPPEGLDDCENFSWNVEDFLRVTAAGSGLTTRSSGAALLASLLIITLALF